MDTRTNGPFYDSTIHRLLEDPTPKGWHRANYTTGRGGSDPNELKPESEWVYHEVEAIVSAELWDECKAILDDRRGSRKKPAKRTRHLFAGLMYCGCGKKMYVPSKSRNYVCQACRNKIAIEDIDHIFIEQLKGFFLSPEDVGRYLDEANATRAEKEAEVDRLKREVGDIRKKLDDLFGLYHQGLLPKEGFTERYQPLYDRQKELEPLLAEAEAALDILNVDTLSSDHILTEGQNLADRWPRLNRQERRAIVDELVEEIVIDGKEVSINLFYFPFSEDVAKCPPTLSPGERG